MKLIKRLVLIGICVVLLLMTALTYKGYERYKLAIDEKPIIEAVNEIRSRDSYVTYDKISPDFLNAVVAVEDHRFFYRNGLDIIALTRALLTNIKAGEIVEGGSTITQQLAKNIYFNNKTSLTRKVAEVFFLFDFEKLYSKEEILELYVNIIYYGDLYYGVQDASVGYFNKEPIDLTLFEASLLAGLPQSPSIYQLSTGKEKALKRQNVVLRAMKENGFITELEYEKVIEEK